MKRLSCCLMLVLAGAAPARAHFLWVLPGDAGAAKVRVVFSDAPRPDDPALLKKVAGAEINWRGPDVDGGWPVGLEKAIVGKDALEAAVPGRGVREVAVVCHYGVTQHGKSEPFLLHYYAKGFLGLELAAGRPPDLVFRPWEVMDLEIVPLKKDDAVRVLWKGGPLAGAEVVLLVPGADKPVTTKTDEQGLVRLPRRSAGGVFGVRARHVENTAGEFGGKAYKEVRHYATMTVALPGPRAGASADRPAADPEATRLLAEARAARALWTDFPGFTADVEINLDGKVSRAHLTVSDKGKVKLDGLDGADKQAVAWARGQLASAVSHRLDSGGETETPCAFADADTTHPLGRAIKVVSDEFDSGFRVRDRQILVVQRLMRDARFTITMLENRTTADGKYLPVSYVVDTWDLASGQLKSSDAFRQDWEHVGRFDLPRGVLVVSSSSGKQQARSLTLSNWKLLGEK
jgi:hypothetical protein